MRIGDLNRQQLIELKERYYTEKNKSVSYGEFSNIENLVTDEEIFNEYGDVEFSNDDFFCSMGKEEKDENTVYIVIQTGMNDYCEDRPMIHCVTKYYEKAKNTMMEIVKKIEKDIKDCFDEDDITVNKELENDRFEVWFTTDTNYYSINVDIYKERIED